MNQRKKAPKRARNKDAKGKAPAPQGASSHVKTYAPIANKYFNGQLRRQAMQVMLPEKCGSDFVLQASQQPVLVCARHFHRTFDISGATHPDGFRVIVSPDLFRPAFHTSPAAVTVPALGYGSVALNSNRVEFDSFGIMRQKQSFTISSGDLVYITTAQTITDGAGTAKTGFSILANAAAQTLTYSVKDITQKHAVPHTINMYYKVAGGNWTLVGAGTSIQIQAGELQTRSASLAANAHAIAWSCEAASTGLVFEITLGLPDSSITTAAAETMGPPFEQAVEELDVQYGRVTNLALLITNTSSSLYNGGNVNCGRVPSSFNPWGSVVTELSQLDSRRVYTGPASQGCYTWWMGNEESQNEIADPATLREAYKDAEYLFADLNSWSPQSSARISIHWCVEFYSKKQIFEKIRTPIYDESYRVMRQILLAVPAASCNPEHGKTFKEYANKAISMGNDAVHWVSDHKDALLAAMALLSELAA